MKQGILFDLDGTLWDATHQIVPAWNEALASLGWPERITHPQLCACMGKTKPEITAIIFPNRTLPERERAWEVLISFEERALRRTGGTLYPGLRETLSGLKKRYALGIVSNCQRGYIPTFLDAHGLWELFDDYEEQGRSGLDKAANIRLVSERLGLERVLYLGDTEGDRLAAEGAGVPFLWATWGFGKPEAPAAAIFSLPELPEAAQKLLG